VLSLTLVTCLVLQPELALAQQPEARNNMCIAKNNGATQATAAPPKVEHLDVKPAALPYSGKNNVSYGQFECLGEWILAMAAVLALSDGSENEAQVGRYKYYIYGYGYATAIERLDCG
jgi:hypothetical protein